MKPFSRGSIAQFFAVFALIPALATPVCRVKKCTVVQNIMIDFIFQAVLNAHIF
jgi:hypothetical protein